MAIDLTFLPYLRLEVYLFTAVISYTLRSTAIQALIQDKVCVQSGVIPSICNQIHNQTYQQIFNAIQPTASNYNLYEKIILNTSCILLFFFVGNWIDLHGFKAVKILLLISAVTGFLESIGLLLNALYFDWPTWVILLSFLPSAVSGGQNVRLMTAAVHVTRETKQKLVAVRMALYQVCIVLGGSLGNLIVSYLLNATPFGNKSQLKNFAGVFVVCCVSELLQTFWICITFRRSNDIRVFDPSVQKSSKMSILRRLIKLWDFDNFRKAFKTATQKRLDKARLKLWLLILASCIILLKINGPVNILYPFTEKALGWNNARYSLVGGISSFISTPLTFIATAICVQVLNLHDSTLGVMGSVCGLISTLARGTITTDAGYYFAQIIGTFGGMAQNVVQSIIKTLVEQNEIGRIFTFLHAVEIFVDLALAPLITLIFNYTFPFMPGFVFILLGGFMLIPVVIFIYLYTEERKQFKKQTNRLMRVESEEQTSVTGTSTSEPSSLTSSGERSLRGTTALKSIGSELSQAVSFEIVKQKQRT